MAGEATSDIVGFMNKSMGGFFSQNALWFALAMLVAFVGIVLWLRKKGKLFPEYNIRVLRWERWGSMMSPLIMDWARFIKDEKNPTGTYELKSTKELLPAAKFKDFVSGDTLMYFTNERGEHFPLRPNFDLADPKFEPVIDEGIKFIAAKELADSYEKHRKPTWWMQYMGIIIVCVAGILMMIMFWTVSGSLEKAAGTIANGAETLAKYCGNAAKPPG